MELELRENGPRTAWLPLFLDFLDRIRIISKEAREPIPLRPYTAQKIALATICDALDRDVHRINCLKARQLGISTVLLALDLFWLQIHPGLQGALIADTGANKENFREIITQMLDSLPHGFRVPVAKHNRNLLILKNGSTLQYMSAGKGRNNALGRSRALNFAHITEISSFGDLKGVETLLSALADENPHRLYVFESTALGFNLWYDIVQEAKRDPTQAFVFIGWWAKESYRFERGTEAFERYWNFHPRLMPREEHAHKIVLEAYGFDIAPEQWAWRRWKATQMSEASLLEEFPSHESEAFVTSGSTFFSNIKIANDITTIDRLNVVPRKYRCTLGSRFVDLKLEETQENADLLIWEEPNPLGKYVAGVDPAFGGGADADRTVISIWRCYADKMVQVAEYCTAIPTTQQCAWVLAYLVACYRDCMVNLEINGPGAQVMSEIRYLKQQVSIGHLTDYVVRLGRTDILEGLRWFLYHRVDAGGAAWAYNWRTDLKTKFAALNRMRDCYNQDQFIVRSPALLREMAVLRQDREKIAAPSGKKDDRAMSGMLACYAWCEWVRPGMMAANRTFAIERRRQEQAEALRDGTPVARVADGIVQNFLRKQQAARRAELMRRIIEG